MSWASFLFLFFPPFGTCQLVCRQLMLDSDSQLMHEVLVGADSLQLCVTFQCML